MKLSRKLLPAIAMLLVSAVMMSTASFAWFSVNTTAEANGMSVTVASAKNILISTAEDGPFGSSATFAETATALEPASAVEAISPKFYYMSKAGTGMTAENTSYGTNPEFAAATEDKHYITFTAYLKVVGEGVDGTTITPNVQFTYVDSPVYKAFRALFVVDDTTSYLYAPVGGTACKPIASVDEGTKAPVEGDLEVLDTNNTTPIVPDVEKEQVYKVTVYIWLEGQDAACTAANAITLKNNGINIDFNIPAV